MEWSSEWQPLHRNYFLALRLYRIKVAWLGGHLRCCRKKHFHQLNSYSHDPAPDSHPSCFPKALVLEKPLPPYLKLCTSC
ncbi:hypothetical protein BpHYR1_041388 [Brachionus plicatilis]|uniref:Uncharacterized protein n=1 Tax=Brachionus plicatilis TaxID=10195 RepID=A0A3M7RCF2_BRAPC|nr:hypothetical protein BpHYR1_041388 [Brachionus plicatilis]